MTYFNLHKRTAKPESDEPAEEELAEDEAAEDDDEEDGSAGLVGALWAGISGPGQWLAAHGQPGLAYVLYVGSVWAAGFYGGWVTVGVVAGWLLLVGLFTPPEALDRLTGWVERRRDRAPAALPSGASPPGGREGILRLLYDLIGEDRGVHLATVLAHLQEHGQWEGKEVADLRRHLEALRIPVQPKLKIAGTPTRGVAKADLDALPPLRETPPSPSGRLPI